MTTPFIGAILSGGMSRRYGSPKALVEVGGVRLVDRAADALRRAGAAHIVVVVNDAGLAAAIGLPHRPDILEGVGALAGVHVALVDARARDARGAVVLACDMPFVPSSLLTELVSRADGADVVLPQSQGPRGMEPLCGYYGVECIPAIERAARRGDARLIGFHPDVRLKTVPLEDVATFGDPAVLFRNLNSPADREEAERMVRQSSHDT